MDQKNPHSIIKQIDSHPIPADDESVQALQRTHPEFGQVSSDTPADELKTSSELREEYIDTIAKTECWHIFKTTLPYHTHSVYFWHIPLGEGYKIDNSEGEFDLFANAVALAKFTEIDDIDDIVDAGCPRCGSDSLSTGMRPSGSHRQSCSECDFQITI